MQRLSWTDLLTSQFEVDAIPIRVFTVCHPKHDLIAVRIESSLLQEGRLAVSLKFPYGSNEWGKAADWEHPDRHATQHRIEDRRADLTRILDADRYCVRVNWSAGADIQTKSPHEYVIASEAKQSATPRDDMEDGPLEVVVAFSPAEFSSPLPAFDEVRKAAADYWSQFWTCGAAISFSGSSDPRAAELERRVVLSQYLTAIQCAGSCPPQETGLTCNSWFGKSHLEMHWWHAVHFALWDRLELLERSLPCCVGFRVRISGRASTRESRPRRRRLCRR